jgi:dephospho-CoA kinase
MRVPEDIGVNEINISLLLPSPIMLIGLTGRNASGKSTLVEWFSKKGMKSFSCSDSIRAWLREQDKEITRDALIEGGRELRRQGGGGILAEMLIEMLDGDDAVIDSIRTPAEVSALRSRGDFFLIEVKASEEIRWARLQSRARPGDPIEKNVFLEQENKELRAKDAAGQDLEATAEMSDFQIFNDGSVEKLNSELDDLWAKIK